MLLLILMPFIGLARGQALPQSPVAMVNGRVMGLPNGNVASFQVMLVSDGAPCAVLQTHPLADGSLRFSSVRSGEYRVAVIGLPEAYGIATMTAGALDLLFNLVFHLLSTREPYSEAVFQRCEQETLRPFQNFSPGPFA